MTARLCHGLKLGVFAPLCDATTADPARIARKAETLGFDSYWVPEHGVIPQGSADIYPGKSDSDPPPDYLFRMPDPFIALSRAAAVTSTIRLGTGVALVPERNPIVGAKEIASVDHYSGGRVLYGIGTGWNEPECTVLGGDFAHRWTQATEAVAVMKKLWSGEYVEHHGKYYDFPPLLCRPAPAHKPHPPVLLGSIGSPLVFKRVAKWGDGWLPFTSDPAEIARGKAEIARLAQEFGRDPAAFEIILFATPDGGMSNRTALAEVARSGADGAVLWLTGQSNDDVEAELETLAGLFD
ncbi:MAG: TIGR03619 family F420-dependent LLM class oxidoreductase [Gammaproteobacteria bacterium]